VLGEASGKQAQFSVHLLSVSDQKRPSIGGRGLELGELSHSLLLVSGKSSCKKTQLTVHSV